jgi:hypothetical protein
MEKEENRKKDTGKEKDPTKEYEEEYPENGDNVKAGGGNKRELPNNPAENAERSAPDEEQE